MFDPLCRIKVPTGFAMTITSLQLLQMVVGCAINLAALNYKSRGSILTHFDRSDHVMFFPRGGMWCEPHQHYLESPHVLQLFPALCKVPSQQNNNTIFISSNWNTICKYANIKQQICKYTICKYANIQYANMPLKVNFLFRRFFQQAYFTGGSSKRNSAADKKQDWFFNHWTSLFWK